MVISDKITDKFSKSFLILKNGGKIEFRNMDIRELLAITKERDASDLHLSVGIPPVLRIIRNIIRVRKNLSNACNDSNG